jgi:capsular polysaccharide biosynthesis protein
MLLAKLHWILLGGVLAAAVAYFATVYLISPTYVSSITMYVYSDSSATVQGSVSAELSAAESLAETYAVVLKSNPVLDAVAEEVQSTTGTYVTRGQVSGSAAVSVVSGSQLLQITVTTTDPNLSYAIASAFGEAAPAEIIRITKAGGVELVNTAEVPTYPSSPSLSKNAAMGFVVGMVIVVAILVLHMLADTTIYLSEDVAKLTDKTILGEVTQFGKNDIPTKGWTMVQGGSIAHGKKKES